MPLAPHRPSLVAMAVCCLAGQALIPVRTALAQHAGHDAGVATVVPISPRAIGTVRFPNAGARAAQAPLREGIAQLHNFHYDEAASALRAAQAADPTLALAYWAEALSYSHVVWGTEALDSSRAVLARLGATPAARLARARTADERAFGAMVEAFYADGPLPARTRRAAEAGRQWAATSPATDEALAFAAVTVMMQGYVARGPAGDSLLAEAAGYAQRLYARSPQHPGAAHYLIHAWDRPSTAQRGLAAARAYDRIAPDAEHALHMPSHIYYQLGMWSEMARSNERAWAASRMRDAAGRPGAGSPHALEWLQYAYLQQGRWRAARALVDTARQRWGGERDAANRSDEVHAVAFLAFRYGADTGDWSVWPAAAGGADAVTGFDGATWSARASGMAITRLYHEAVAPMLARRDTTLLSATAARLAAYAPTMGGDDPAAGMRMQRLTAHMAALLLRAGGDTAGLRQATARLAVLPAGGGPSIPAILSPRELAAAGQLALGDAHAAAASYDTALAAFPGRSSLLLGAARARAAAGDSAGSRRAYAQLRANWARADATVPALAEVRAASARR